MARRGGIKTSMTDSIFSSLIMPLMGVLLIIFLAYWGTKWIAKRYNRLSSGKYMRILERVSLGQDKCLLLVEMAGKIFFLGVGPQGVDTIEVFQKDQIAEMAAIDEGGGTFPHLMTEMIKKQSPFGSRGRKRDERDEEGR